MADQTADDFNWVSAQAQCSTGVMFEQLRTRVRADVQTRNELTTRDDEWRFEFESEDDAFDVTRVRGSLADPEVSAVVTFERAGRRILIHSEEIDVNITAIVTLDPGGSCRLVVGEALYSDWEIRRMALELLFFEEHEEQES